MERRGPAALLHSHLAFIKDLWRLTKAVAICALIPPRSGGPGSAQIRRVYRRRSESGHRPRSVRQAAAHSQARAAYSVGAETRVAFQCAGAYSRTARPASAAHDIF